jgi:hypothetical protein
VIKQDDQIKPCGLKFVLGGVSYKEVEVDIKFKSGTTELSNGHIGKVYSTDPPLLTRQP